MITKELTDQIEQIVCSAGALIEDVHGVADCKTKEGHSNFVTKYDSKVQAFLIEHFRRLLPDAEYLCEEDGYNTEDSQTGYTFIIDPIDGTTNFICGFMFSAVSVALAFRGELLYGAVYNPFRHELFTAQKGCGAFLNHQPIHMTERPLADGVMHFGGAPYYPEMRTRVATLQSAVAVRTMDLREMGAASLGLCYTACNRCVAYASPILCTWDYAAAAVVLTEAGGVITDFEGQPLQLRNKVSVAAGTKAAHAEVLSIIAEN